MDQFIDRIAEYGPVWALVFGFCLAVYKGITKTSDLLFSNEIDPLSPTKQPKGLLVPAIKEHLGVFRRTEVLVESMSDATKAMLDNNERDTRHAIRMEQLMEIIEKRLKALDVTNNERVHKALIQLSEVMLDSMSFHGADPDMVEKHRDKLRGLLDTVSLN